MIKMQEGNYTDFDLQLRSMLEDAEEKAPRCVWKAVDSALGRGTAPLAKWGWAALSCLAAASLALFLALPGGKVQEPAAVVAEVAEEVTETPQAVVEQIAELQKKPVIPVAVRPYVPAAAAAPEEVVAEAENSPEAETAPTAQEAPVAQGSGTGAGQSSATAPKVWKDPFAEPASVSRRPAPKFAVGGTMGSNDNVSSGFNPGGRFASQGALVVLPSEGLTETGESAFAIPVSLGLDARFYLSDRISLGTGLQYTILSRSFKGDYKGEKGLAVTHGLHYVGIPLNLYADIIRNKSFDFYAFGGGAAEVAVKNNYHISTASGVQTISESVEGLQWSVGAGVGLQFNLNDTFGIFVDPSIDYYFDCNQPRSVRTENPFVFNLKAGLRFSL